MHRQFKTVCHTVPEYNISLKLVKDKVYYVYIENDAYDRPGRHYYREQPFTQVEMDYFSNYKNAINAHEFFIYLISETFPKYMYTKKELRDNKINEIMSER